LRIDLHIHSSASDGGLAPAAVVEAARAGGLDIIALADHDTVAGIAPAQVAATGVLHIIPAIELSTYHSSGELHMLGYFINPNHAALMNYGARASGAREVRMRDMLARLGGAGINVNFEEVLEAAGARPSSVGRPHLARALVKRGYATTVSDAFDRLIGDHAPAFVPTHLATPAQAIDLIHDAGGLAVWAHPRSELVPAELPAFVDAGLDGIECYRPRVAHPESERIARIADDHNLYVTGGSDWHGEWQGRLGEFAVGRDDVAEFLDAGGI
jgi:3',5'-nucleoside bisphosphate phosphatase